MVLVRIWLLENVFFSVGESCLCLIFKKGKNYYFHCYYKLKLHFHEHLVAELHPEALIL